MGTNHPAALESAADSIKGVSTQGFFASDVVDKEPILASVFMVVSVSKLLHRDDSGNSM